MKRLEYTTKSGRTVIVEIIPPYTGDSDTEFDVKVTVFDGKKVIGKDRGKYVHGQITRNGTTVYGYIGKMAFSDSDHANAINDMVEAKKQQINKTINEKMQKNVTGYDIVKKAFWDNQVALDEYADKSEQYMEQESPSVAYPNSNTQKQTENELSELTKKYPRAALFVKAESWSDFAHNPDKTYAGRQAMKAIRDGQDLESVKNKMDSWADRAVWN